MNELNARGKLAAFHAKQAEEAAQVRQMEAEAELETAQEASRQAEEADRARLEALRGERLELAEIESMTEAEKSHYDQMNAAPVIVEQFFSEARRREEEEYASQLNAEYEQYLISNRRPGGASGNTRVIQEAEKIRREKAALFLADRERRELLAETQPDDIHRAAHSLGERGRVILNELFEKAPPMIERVRESKQAIASQRNNTLKDKYITEMQSAVKDGSIPRHIAQQIREKYQGMGLDVSTAAEAVSKLRRY